MAKKFIIELKRDGSHLEKGGYTLGDIYINGKHECVSLEDEYRKEKVYGETRIPAGTYRIKFRKEGRMHYDHLTELGKDFHKGMLHLQDVPGFEFILMHEGNFEKNTLGCILIGTAKNREAGTITESKKAYKIFYPKVRDALLRGEEVYITITDFPTEKK